MMRYETKVKLLSAASLALLLLWGLGELFAPERRLSRSEAGRLLSGEPEAATALLLKSPGTELRLEKRGGAWLLLEGGLSLPAAGRRVESFLEALAAVESRRPVASSREAWEGLGLAEGEARSLLVKDSADRALAEFAVGSRAPGGEELYLRLAGSEASYAVDAGFESYLDGGRLSWLDRRLLPPAEAHEVQALSLRAEIELEENPRLALSYALGRRAEGWSSGDRALDALAVESLLRALLNLEAEDLAAEAPAMAFERIQARFEIELGSGEKRAIEVGSTLGEGEGGAEGRFWARRAGEEGPAYQVSAYSLRNLLKPLAELEPRREGGS